MMSGTWSKLKKTLSFKTSGGSGSPSQIPPRVPNQSDSRSTVPRSSSSSSRFSSLGSSGRSSKKDCAICLGNVKTGQGQAIFTAECSHSFHFNCIASSVKHGNYLCPICRSKWKDIPFQLPTASVGANHNATGRAQVSPFQDPLQDYTDSYPDAWQQPNPIPHAPFYYSDDEPLVISTDPTVPASSAPSIIVSIKAFPEFPAVAATESVSDFAVLVGVGAPTLTDDARYAERAPIDLVAVLDVSGSMVGSKLFLLKHAVCFIIDNLGPADRLSIVSFASSAHRILPLRRMTNGGREDARVAVNSLYANGGTDIIEGLIKGTRVLEERRERNPVASIILLSDGNDSYRFYQNQIYSNLTESPVFSNMLPNSVPNENLQLSFPVHTFGFGADHGSAVMHSISDVSAGTFSFIESIDMVQDAFARCIGGLLSVVARELRLTITSRSPGVGIGSISSGRYANEICNLGLRGVIDIGDLYADEEKNILVHLSIPASPIADQGGDKGVEKMLSLVSVACSYKDSATKAAVQLEGEKVEIRRPGVVSPTDATVSLEVDRQRNRLWVVKGLAEAKEMAESGNLEGAQALLTNRRANLLASASAQAGDALCNWLEAELIELGERMSNMERYERAGRAYALSGLSSHSWQRATTRGDSNTQTTVMREGGSSIRSGSIGYNTPAMVRMLTRSQELSGVFMREQQA